MRKSSALSHQKGELTFRACRLVRRRISRRQLQATMTTALEGVRARSD